MYSRAFPGQDREKSAIVSSEFVNDAIDVIVAHKSGHSGGAPPGTQTSQGGELIRVMNSSGADRVLGDVLELKDYLITDPAWDKRRVWIDGGTPSDVAAQYAVCWEPIPDGKIGWASIARMVAVKYNPSDGTPAAKEIWGVKPGEYALRKGLPGYKVHRVVDAASDNIMLAVRNESTTQTIPFRNDESSETAPANGILQIVETDLEAGSEVVSIKRPYETASPLCYKYAYAINAGGDVDAGEMGTCYLLHGALEFPIRALYDSAESGGDPKFGDVLGPKIGSWKLSKGLFGFYALGNADSGDELVTVQFDPPTGMTPWKNDESSTSIPAHATFDITGAERINYHGILKGKRPTTTFSTEWATNGPRAVAAGKYGLCFANGEPREASYDSGTPAVNEIWGAKGAQDTLTKNYPGFIVEGITDATNKLMMVRPFPSRSYLCKAGSNIAKGATGNVTIWVGASGSEAASTFAVVNARAKWAAITSGKFCSLTWLQTSTPYVSPLECA